VGFESHHCSKAKENEMKTFSKKGFIWQDEATLLLKKVPFFVRKFARARVEELVRSEGRLEVQAEDVERARIDFLKDIDRQEKAEKEKSKDYSSPALYQVDACKGMALGCPFGLVDTQRVAEEISAHLEELRITEFLLERTEGLLLPHHRIKVAIAGCPNSCTQPQVKDIGIIAQAVPARGEGHCTDCGLCVESCQERAITLEQKRPLIHRQQCVNCGLCIRSCLEGAIIQEKEGYRLLMAGRLGRHPRLGQEILSLAPKEDMINKVRTILDYFKSLAKTGEKFSHFIERTSHLL
jgi:anaerobic sulfite reductase subunit C